MCLGMARTCFPIGFHFQRLKIVHTGRAMLPPLQNCARIRTLSRNLLNDLIRASQDVEALGAKDRNLVQEAKHICAQLAEPQIGTDGRILEWNDEFVEADPHHRHLSHLYELYPGVGITSKTPRLEKAARKSLEIHGDDGSGWSIVWRMIMWARLRGVGTCRTHHRHVPTPCRH